MKFTPLFGLNRAGQNGAISPMAEDPKFGTFSLKRFNWDYYQASVVEEIELVDCAETESFETNIPDPGFREFYSQYKCTKDG